MSEKDKIRHPEVDLKKHLPIKEYGLLQVWEWPDGTTVYMNLEKGKETLRMAHSSGWYKEVTGAGSTVEASPNNHVTYSKGGVTVTFDNNSDTKSDGHVRMSVNHDTHIEVKKNASIAVAGHADVVGVGHVKVAATDIYLGSTEGSIVLNAARDIEMKATGGRILAQAKNVVQITSESADIHMEAPENIVMNSGKSNITLANKNVTEKAQGSIGNKADGNVSYKGRSFYGQGESEMHLKSGKVKLGGGDLVEAVSGANLATPPWVAGGGPPEDAPEIDEG